jgi:hypothetical protein
MRKEYDFSKSRKNPYAKQRASQLSQPKRQRFALESPHMSPITLTVIPAPAPGAPYSLCAADPTTGLCLDPGMDQAAPDLVCGADACGRVLATRLGLNKIYGKALICLCGAYNIAPQ